MSSKMKKRRITVAGVIVIIVIVLFAVVGAGTGAKVVTVNDIAEGGYDGKKVEVSGTVVDNSYTVDMDGVLTFVIKSDDGTAQFPVRYDKGVSSTFGNGVTAICTGRVIDGVINCTELVTKCPSKYESGSSAISIYQLLSYDGDAMLGKTVKIVGQVSALGPATEEIRLVLLDVDGDVALNVVFAGALSEEVVDGADVVITGALDDQGRFLATEIALAE